MRVGVTKRWVQQRKGVVGSGCGMKLGVVKRRVYVAKRRVWHAGGCSKEEGMAVKIVWHGGGCTHLLLFYSLAINANVE